MPAAEAETVGAIDAIVSYRERLISEHGEEGFVTAVDPTTVTALLGAMTIEDRDTHARALHEYGMTRNAEARSSSKFDSMLAVEALKRAVEAQQRPPSPPKPLAEQQAMFDQA